MWKKMVLALAIAGAMSPVAMGCGEYFIGAEVAASQGDETAAVRAVAEANFAAIAKGDKSGIEKCWDMHQGLVYTAYSGGYGAGIGSTPVSKVLDTWTKSPDVKAAASIGKVELIGKTMASVRAEFTWKGNTFEEILIMNHANTGWKIVAKYFEMKK